MTWYILSLTGGFMISFLLGYISARGKGKRENDIAIMVIANLKATIEIYKTTNKEQKEYLTKKNDELKKEIEKLKNLKQ